MNNYLGQLPVPHFFASLTRGEFGSKVDTDLLAEFGHRAPDEAQRLHNEKEGHSLCAECGGTGNELWSMYRPCSECGGNGIAERFGARPALARRYLLRRERQSRQRAVRGPRDWNVEIRCWLSYWFGVGNWMHNRRDECHRCGALPSDVDFEMNRVGPRRIECMDRESCEHVALETAHAQ